MGLMDSNITRTMYYIIVLVFSAATFGLLSEACSSVQGLMNCPRRLLGSITLGAFTVLVSLAAIPISFFQFGPQFVELILLIVIFLCITANVALMTSPETQALHYFILPWPSEIFIIFAIFNLVFINQQRKEGETKTSPNEGV